METSMKQDRNFYSNGASPAVGRARAFTLSFLAAGVLAACGGSSDADTPKPPVAKPLELTILHINDHHSNLDS
ncbi:MAG: hypothetical protein AB7E55_18680, partial [Pigmentiphaga sp.]